FYLRSGPSGHPEGRASHKPVVEEHRDDNTGPSHDAIHIPAGCQPCAHSPQSNTLRSLRNQSRSATPR
ncbi:MAG: hypothetical protein WCR20_14435, partial [Verrucomicrobiota bacterium]